MEDTGKKQSFVKGAAILAAAGIIVKIIGAIYKMPLYNMLSASAVTTFTISYYIYNLLLTVSTVGIPVALSRLVSAAMATGRINQARRYYKVAMPVFVLIGLVCMGFMLLFAGQLAAFMEVNEAEAGIRVLAPAVFFACVLAVYRGYTQGFEDMFPTAMSQIIEVVCKMGVGLTVAYFFIKKGYAESTVCAGAITGTVVGMGLSIPAMMYYKKKRDNALRLLGEPTDTPMGLSESLKTLMRVSVPITAGVIVLQVVLLLNTKVVIARLQSGAGFSYEDAKTLNGVREEAMTLFNLPSALIMTPITTSVIPAISAALTSRRPKGARRIMESAMKLTNLLAMPAGVGIAVLSSPIFSALYPKDAASGDGGRMLGILGIAAYFICIQLITTAILQASGHEKLAMLTLPAGCISQVLIVWFLVGKVGVIGATIGTTLCYVIIFTLNYILIKKKLPLPPRFLRTFVKPLFCTVVMGVAAKAVYGLAARLLPSLAAGRMGTVVLLAGTICVSVVIYAVLVVFIGAISRADLKLFPKGDKIADMLKIR